VYAEGSPDNKRRETTATSGVTITLPDDLSKPQGAAPWLP
jgi:hypothetical protein